MSLWQDISARITSLFLPQVQIRPQRTVFDGEPEQARLERPLLAHSQTRWFQSDIETAIHLSDTGQLRMAGMLAQALRRDGTLGGILSTRTGGLCRLPKIFRGTPNVVLELEGRDDRGLFDKIFDPKELALFAGDGIVLGVGVGELIWLPDRSEPVFVRLDPQFLRYDWSQDRWYYAAYGGLVHVQPGDGRWILHTPGGYQQPWANGRWPSLGRAYVAKDHAFQYRENYSGKLANPARVAVAPQGAGDMQKQSWFRKVMAWGINSVFGVTPGYDVKLLESNGRGYEVFQATIDTSDKEFMIDLAGQIVTITGGAGFANADIHATIRTDLIQGDGDGLAETINDQGLRPIVNRLFGAGARGSVAWDTRPPADLKAEADAITSAAAAITAANEALAKYGFQLDAKEMATRFKMPVRELAPAPTSPASQPTSPPTLTLVQNDPSEPTADPIAALAAKMTEHGVVRCEHGSSNRCRLCGVERTRDFDPGVDGAEHAWRIAWQPIKGQEAAA